MALACPYNAHITYINSKLNYINQCIDFYSSKYDQFIDTKDFNKKTSNVHMEQFCETCSLKINSLFRLKRVFLYRFDFIKS